MIKIGIAGYGNLGRGVEAALSQQPDMELCAVFTRRDASSVKPASGAPVFALTAAKDWADRLDAVILCGGSATDLPVQTPEMAALFNVVDSFDTHADIPAHCQAADAAAKASGHTAVLSAGWDPGLFSLARTVFSSVLPEGADYTFWGPGVSQGHSDAVRRIAGVLDARQYTLPVPAALELARSGKNPPLTTREKHTRLCYVVAEEGADLARIEREIKTMPKYFADYDTTVRFITQAEMDRDHAGLPHGGFVIRGGATALGDKHTLEFSLKLGSNAQFTGSVLAACARAAVRMNARGETGAFTMPEIRPCDLSPLEKDVIRSKLT